MGIDYARGITIDSAGSPYIVGNFDNTGAFSQTILTSSGSNDSFIAKLSTYGVIPFTINT